jgi:hypothetical protein
MGIPLGTRAQIERRQPGQIAGDQRTAFLSADML